ncbi:MAG: hypothetical protein WD468_06970 [Pirellulales bacterium]
MLRYELLLAGIIALTSLATGGCRACSSCHDYDPPVADCQCDAWGTHRAGSACGGGCSTCSGCSGGGCSTCNGGGHVESQYSEGGYPGEGSYTSESMMSQ